MQDLKGLLIDITDVKIDIYAEVVYASSQSPPFIIAINAVDGNFLFKRYITDGSQNIRMND